MERKAGRAPNPGAPVAYRPDGSLMPACVVGTSSGFGCGEKAPSIRPASKTLRMARLVWRQGRGVGSVIVCFRCVLLCDTSRMPSRG